MFKKMLKQIQGIKRPKGNVDPLTWGPIKVTPKDLGLPMAKKKSAKVKKVKVKSKIATHHINSAYRKK